MVMIRSGAGDWSLLPPAALRASQAPAADALGQAVQLGIRNSMHMAGEALPLLSAFQLCLPSQGRLSACKLGDLLSPPVY